MKKIVVGSFLALITLLVTSTAISFAWYATSDVLKIEYMEISISGDKELLIGLKNSTDINDYSEEIKQDQLKKVDKFKPVSTMCSSRWIESKSQDPIFYDSYNKGNMRFVEDQSGKTKGYVLPDEVVAESGYFSQDLYLYCEKNYYAVLDASTILIPDLEKNRTKAKEMAVEHPEMGSEEEILAKLNQLADSARISVLTTKDDFYSYKIVDPYRNSNTPTILGGVMDSDLDGEFDLWTKSDTSKYEILYGDVNDRSKIIYGFNEKSEEPLPIEERTWFNAKHSKNTNIIDLKKSIENGLVINEEKAFSIDENSNLTERLKMHGTISEEEKERYLYIPIDAFKPTRIVLSIYFEGWDLENVNYTMAGSFKTEVAFSVLDRSIVL